MHAELAGRMASGDDDVSLLRGVVATAFHLNGLPPDLSRPVEERLELLERARSAALKLALIETELNALWRQARLHVSGGDVVRARALLEDAQRRSEEAPAMRPWILLDLGTCARLMGEWDEAHSWLQAALAALLTERFDAHKLTRASIFGEFFEIYLAWGTPDQALVWLERERQAAEEVPRPETQYVYALNSIDYALACEDWQGAIAQTEDCLDSPELLRVSPDARAKLLVRRALAWNQGGLLEVSRSEKYFHEALADPSLRGKERLDSILFYAYLEAGRGRLDEAETWLQLAREPLAELTGDERRLYDAAYPSAFFHAIASHVAILREEPVEVLAKHLERMHATFDDLLEEWSRTPLLPGGIGFLIKGRRRIILSQLFQLLILVHGEEEGARLAFEKLLRTHALGSDSRRRGIGHVDVAALRRELLTEGEALFAYFPAPDRSHLFVVEETRLSYFPVARSVDIRDAQARLIRTLSSRPSHEDDGTVSPSDRKRWRAAAREFADLVLPDPALEILLGSEAVTVVGVDLRAWLPFESLPVSDAQDALTVGEVVAVSHLPSIPLGVDLERRRLADPRAAQDLALRLLAAPEHSERVADSWPELLPLPRDGGDFENLWKPYPAAATDVLIGAPASREALFREETATVLQFVCHGVYDSDRLRPAGLVLSPGEGRRGGMAPSGLFWCEDAERVPASPLVVLAACGTGRGPHRRGDESINHLGGAFLHAGARCVVMAHADLDYGATLALLGHFHEGLVAGAAPSRALRDARAALGRDARFDHPYYHSLLQVVGLGHRPVFR